MSNLAIDLRPPAAVQELADVVSGSGGLLLRCASGTYPLQRALSCLVEPEAGDRVLIVRDGDAGAYVLAILARSGAAATRVVVGGDVELHAPAGRIEFCARDGVALLSPGTVDVQARELCVGADEGRFAVSRATYSGSRLDACIDRIKLVAVSFDAVLDRWVQRLRQSLRRVEELDQLHAGQIERKARDTLSMHGDNTLMTANRLVKVDAEQIHVG